MSGTRVRVCDLVTVQDAKTFQYDFARDTENYNPDYTIAENLHKVRAVRDGDVKRMLCAVPGFDEDGLAQAWSHHMAIFAGRHRFPDANHRTGLYTFNYAIRRKWGKECSMAEADSKEMIARSKDMRKAEGRWYTVQELADRSHRYRQVFAAYEDRLRCENVA